jgi:hypothetical protein
MPDKISGNVGEGFEISTSRTCNVQPTIRIWKVNHHVFLYTPIQNAAKLQQNSHKREMQTMRKGDIYRPTVNPNRIE